MMKPCLAFATAGLILAGCAQPPIPAAPRETSALTGKLTEGTVVSVRQVDVQPTDGAMTGINAVLAGLGQPATAQAADASEVVIRLDNEHATSLIQPPSILSPGDAVSIVEAATTTLHQN